MGERRHTGARHYGARQYESARTHRRAAAYTNAAPRMSGNIRVRGSITRARHHICAATQLRGSIHERGTIVNIDVNEAATNETIRLAAIHKKIIYVCNGWHGRYNRLTFVGMQVYLVYYVRMTSYVCYYSCLCIMYNYVSDVLLVCHSVAMIKNQSSSEHREAGTAAVVQLPL